MAINSWGFGLNGGGLMNGNELMGLRIRFDGGGCTNSARQSICGAPDLMVEDA